MEYLTKPVDLDKVKTVVYHLPGGPAFSVQVDSVRDFIEFGYGDFCDTSEIDGVLHFFPKGNA